MQNLNVPYQNWPVACGLCTAAYSLEATTDEVALLNSVVLFGTHFTKTIHVLVNETKEFFLEMVFLPWQPLGKK